MREVPETSDDSIFRPDSESSDVNTFMSDSEDERIYFPWRVGAL